MSEAPQPPSIASCSDCGGDRVAMGCPTEMHLMRGGPAISFPVSGLTAVVCTGCGRVTFYAKDLARIREAVQKHPRDFQR